MSFDIGSVFALTIATLKGRFWSLLGLWTVYFAMSIVMIIGFSVVVGASAAGLAAFDPETLNNEFAAGGIGASLLASMLVFYLLYLALFFAQHAGVTAMGSPNERFTFADALTRGLKAGLTFLVLILVFFVVYFVLGLIAALVLGLASLASEAVGLALGVLLIPVSIYLTCRFALITPVVAVEGVFNPIKAINRAWSVTKGHALGILVVIVVNIVLAIMFLAVPFLVIAVSGGGGLGVQLTGAPAFFAIITFLFGFVLFQLISAILFAAVHAKISGYNEEQLEDVFE